MGLVGRLGVTALVVMGAMAATRPAEACSPPPNVGIYPEVVDGALEGVPTDGVIAFRANVYGELEDALALLTVEVTQDGAPVEGAIETVEHLGGPSGGDVIVLWRPAAPFAASSDYVATITSTSPDGELAEVMAVLEVATGEGPAGEALTLGLVEPAVSAVAYGAGPRVCCDDGNTCAIPLCAAPESADLPTLVAAIDVPSDPMASQTYVRLRAGVDDGTEPLSVLGLASALQDLSVQHSFEAAAGNYCFALESVSLVDGSIAPLATTCVHHGDLELGEGPNEDFASFLGQCQADPYWEDTDEPYEPDGGSSSGDDGDDADSGDDGDDADSGDDGDDADSGDDGDEADSGSDDGGQNEDDAGCGCTVDPMPRLSTLLLLLIGALGHRRRR
jgi:MYXO-CTERM domain-containing protein